MSQHYTVITELDGLKVQSSSLGVAAIQALVYLSDNIRSYGRWLKVQTSRGNYLQDLAIRTEAIDFGIDKELDSVDRMRTMDDVILRIAAWQVAHFIDRSGTSPARKPYPRRSHLPRPEPSSKGSRQRHCSRRRP